MEFTMAEREISISRDSLDIAKHTTKTQPSTSTDEARKEIKPVAKAVTKKENVVTTGVKRFFGGDPKDVAMHVVTDVFIPAAKNMLVDMCKAGIERLVFGETSTDRRRNALAGRPSYIRTDYNSISSDNRRFISNRDRRDQYFGNIIYRTREEASDVLDHMNDLIDNYGYARVSDFCDLSGISKEYTDMSWGWTDLRDARIRQVSGGFSIDMPKTQRLN